MVILIFEISYHNITISFYLASVKIFKTDQIQSRILVLISHDPKNIDIFLSHYAFLISTKKKCSFKDVRT